MAAKAEWLREKNMQLEREYNLRQQKSSEYEKKIQQSEAELSVLRSELASVHKKIAVQQSSQPSAELPAQPLTPKSTCDALRRLSLEGITEAERDLDEVLKQLEDDTNEITGRLRKRRVFGMLLLFVAILASPGLLLSLHSLGLIEIKEGTHLWRSVTAWEFALETIGAAYHRYVSQVLAHFLRPLEDCSDKNRASMCAGPYMDSVRHRAATTSIQIQRAPSPAALAPRLQPLLYRACPRRRGASAPPCLHAELPYATCRFRMHVLI